MSELQCETCNEMFDVLEDVDSISETGECQECRSDLIYCEGGHFIAWDSLDAMDCHRETGYCSECWNEKMINENENENENENTTNTTNTTIINVNGNTIELEDWELEEFEKTGEILLPNGDVMFNLFPFGKPKK